MDNILEIQNLTKNFPGVLALADVNFSLKPGEIRALLGKNGAGKSTLIKMISGVYTKDSGKIIFEGREIENSSPHKMHQLGICAIYQENELIPFFTVGQSIMLNHEYKKFGFFTDTKRIHEEAHKILAENLGLDINPYTLINDLSVSQKQLVQIAKAFILNPKILIFDEPTAPLSSTEIENLFKIIQMLKQKGVSIIYISHRMDEIFRIAETVTVMRDGRKVGDYELTSLTEKELIRHISGEETSVESFHRTKPNTSKTTALEIRGLCTSFLKNVDVELKEGEILGVFGAEGAGQQILANAIYGQIPCTYNKFRLYGQDTRISHPAHAIKRQIGCVPRDRKREGLVIDFSVRENTSIANLKKFSTLSIMNKRHETDNAQKFIDRMAIKTPSTESSVKNLSGGNQQKVIIARWLSIDLKIFILDYPTAGIDVHAKTEVYRLLRELADDGTSILLITPEYEEIKALCDRVMVMKEGREVAMLPVDTLDEETLLTWAIGSQS